MTPPSKDNPEGSPYSEEEWKVLSEDYEHIRLSLVAHIRRACAAKGLNVEDIKVYGLDPEDLLGAYEKGNCDLTLFYLFQIARALGISVGELSDGLLLVHQRLRVTMECLQSGRSGG